MPDSTPLTLAIAGCGARGRTYARIAASMPERYRIVAAAEPNENYRSQVTSLCQAGSIRGFASAEELLAQPKLSDVLVIATQDKDHLAQALRGLELGYHLLLEKPAAQSQAEVEQIHRAACAAKRQVVLCFVLRYTPFYRAVREFVDSGRLGRLMHLEATEGVGAFHQVHSFVRGHWSKAEDSTPMIVAKCSHDLDYIAWLMNPQRAKKVSSFGSLSWFRPENAPAGATARCTDGCPQVGKCAYDSHLYLTKHQRWLDFIYPKVVEQSTDEEIMEWIGQSPWGRCAWRSGNDVVDHQVVNLEFEGGATASLSMSAFDVGRQLALQGTQGVLRGGESWQDRSKMELWFRPHDAPEEALEAVPLAEVEDAVGYQGHGGGDFGLIDSLDGLIDLSNWSQEILDDSLESHRLAFAAEQSRLRGGIPVELS